MKFESLLGITRPLSCFDLSLVAQLSGENKRQLSQQIHHWARQGKIIALRRGVYTLSLEWRSAPLSLPGLANEIYKPSYLSGQWALSYYGIIPERVSTLTSVTTRVTRVFNNALGHFSYSTLKKNFFWGFVQHKIDAVNVWLAEPEKALLDTWHLNHAEWSLARLVEMRIQNTDLLDMSKLRQYANQWGSPRLVRAAERLVQIHHENQRGYRKI